MSKGEGGPQERISHVYTVHYRIQVPTWPSPGPASQLSVPQTEIKAVVLANTPGLQHCFCSSSCSAGTAPECHAEVGVKS